VWASNLHVILQKQACIKERQQSLLVPPISEEKYFMQTVLDFEQALTRADYQRHKNVLLLELLFLL
jgi:hypothetical protein